MVLLSFLLLYQDRMFALLNVFAFHAFALAGSVAWQAYLQRAPHLFITALIALLFKGVIIPVALRRIVVRRRATSQHRDRRQHRTDDAVRHCAGGTVDRRHAAGDA